MVLIALFKNHKSSELISHDWVGLQGMVASEAQSARILSQNDAHNSWLFQNVSIASLRLSTFHMSTITFLGDVNALYESMRQHCTLASVVILSLPSFNATCWMRAPSSKVAGSQVAPPSVCFGNWGTYPVAYLMHPDAACSFRPPDIQGRMSAIFLTIRMRLSCHKSRARHLLPHLHLKKAWKRLTICLTGLC